MRLGVEAAIVGGEIVVGDLEIVDGRVAACGLAGSGSGIAVPGFVDLQVNGFAGVDFLNASAADYDTAGEALCQTGVTAYQPTLITSPEEALVGALREVPPSALGPRIIGVHLEGPFLAATRIGAHPLGARRDPDLELLERLLAAGPVTQMTIAPELPGALELIDVLCARGVVVSCGHTDATAAEAEAAFDRGARSVTHIFNAMRHFNHRDPGIAAAALVNEDVVVQVILDGHHMAAQTARLIWRAACGRVALVTDAMAAAGNGDGRYVLGGMAVEVLDGVARTPEGALAGSTVTMIEAVRQLYALGVSLEEAVGAATEVPGRLIGQPGLGVLEPGGLADLVVLDDRLDVQKVLVAGDAHVLARG